MSTLLETLAVRLPIIQAPMAGVSSPAMAAAVSQAGALGSIGVGATDAESARKMIHAVRERSTGALNVNVFCHREASANAVVEGEWIKTLAPHFVRFGAEAPKALREIYKSFLVDDAMLKMLIEERPRIVSFHFGLPSAEKVKALKSAGIALLASATSIAEARLLESAGVDALVAQGYEAGGHRGVFDPDAQDDRLGTFALTRLLVRHCGLPVIAAGGIMDGAGISAVLRLGACAAQLGTAFIACPESEADSGYRAALASDAAHHTVMTRAISGRLARCLQNEFTALGESVMERSVPDYPIAYDVGKALNAAAKAKGNFGYGAQWAGQGAPLARSLGAADLIATLAREMR